MTNEEAIKGLKNVSTMFTGYKPNEEMFAMAIKALETVSCIKEKCAYCPHCENCDVDDETLEIKALEQQPCEDWYDVPSNEMTLEQARQAVKDLRKKLAEYLEQQPCEDAVSRQAVDELSKELVHTTRDKADFLCNFWEGLQKLPPVTPKEKTEWIPVSERLPESEGYGHYFLCCLENGIIRILGYSNILTTRCPKGFYYEKENGTTWRQDINPVIAWMPLPESYRAESEGKE